jgi:hypothetical protein
VCVHMSVCLGFDGQDNQELGSIIIVMDTFSTIIDPQHMNTWYLLVDAILFQNGLNGVNCCISANRKRYGMVCPSL